MKTRKTGRRQSGEGRGFRPVRLALFCLALLLMAAPGRAQAPTDMPPPRVELRYEPKDFSFADTLRLFARVEIPPGWHINSDAPLDEYSIPSTVEAGAPGLEFGRPVFPQSHVKHIAALGSEVSLFEGAIEIALPAWRSGETPPEVEKTRFTLNYQACSDAICLPPTSITAFWGDMPPGDGGASVGTAGAGPASGEGTASGAGTMGGAQGLSAGRADGAQPTPPGAAETPFPGGSPLDFSAGVIPLLFALLGAGLALNLTPCVYPMIAITISLFGSQAGVSVGSRLGMSLAYASGIVLTFSALGVFAAFSGSLFGSMLQSAWAQLVIAGTFAVLALGTFGAYPIRVPQFIMGKALQASNARGYFGGLLAGLFAGVLAAPCIGPVVLALLIHVAEKGSVLTGLGMFATLSLGMGLPYVVLGTSSSLLERLPRSGQWMVDVKNILGVVLLILAAYYARGFLGETLYRILFGGLILYIGLYINPFARLEKLSRALSGLVRLGAFAAVLWGTHELGSVLFGRGLPVGGAGTVTAAPMLEWKEYSDATLEGAHAQGRPVLVDFQSKIWCAACREMEEKTFSRPEVQSALRPLELLQVDVDKHPRAEALQERYAVRGIPTIVVLDGRGREVDRIVGFMGPADFLRRLEGAGVVGRSGTASVTVPDARSGRGEAVRDLNGLGSLGFPAAAPLRDRIPWPR